MITIPPYLQKGDTIGLLAPAGFMPFEKIHTCIDVLGDWGYTVALGETVHSHSDNYFSSTDEERCADLQRMLDDDHIKAILCVRGGYGVSRIIDKLSFKKFKKAPKWIIGYSDITVLHAHLYRKHKIASLHAPMAAAFNDEGFMSPYVASLRSALTGEASSFRCEPLQLNRTGEAEGNLVGGNLTLLAHLVGTASDLPTKNKILFIEDVGEYLYNIDRMLLQLKRSGKLKKLAGLVVGGFTDVKDTERPFGATAYEIIQDAVKEYDFPVCYNFPVSHTNENYALKHGLPHKLVVDEAGVRLSEIVAK
ncbi:S66 peptidase family protein [Pseudocnuella soli]|uniref:S66 peptidase family protein n=1 Tax=Pseudocnuella soli TaxID=2502779 RepID=UPI00104EB70C|nr:LD-carboxypeptidase [Pseudocnuella soli]